MPLENYEQISRTEKYGEFTYGVLVQVSYPGGVDTIPKADLYDMQDLAEQIGQVLEKVHYRDDATEIAKHKEQNARFRQLFDGEMIHMQEIPNKYSQSAYNIHNPWYVIATRIGFFELGRRKRVISIDWSETSVMSKAESLFPAENVTKDDRLIHAWGYEKAAEYIRTIMRLGNVEDPV